MGDRDMFLGDRGRFWGDRDRFWTTGTGFAGVRDSGGCSISRVPGSWGETEGGGWCAMGDFFARQLVVLVMASHRGALRPDAASWSTARHRMRGRGAAATRGMAHMLLVMRRHRGALPSCAREGEWVEQERVDRIARVGWCAYWRWQVTAGRCAVVLRAGPLRVIECAGGGRLARAGWRTCWRLQVAADHSSGTILCFLL